MNAVLRYSLAHTMSKTFPLYIVNEYPKSGGSWLGEMLGEGLGVPFPRNQLPVLGSSILHGHMKHSWNMHNVVVLWRDGRDVVVSEYFHSLIKNDRGNSVLVNKTRAELGLSDYEDIQSNLPAFMEYIFDDRHKLTWPKFVDIWNRKPSVVYASYEALKENCQAELLRIYNELGVDYISESQCSDIVKKYSFRNMSGRKEGAVNTNSFLRKGIVGDWKNHFTLESREIFQKYAGHALLALGYENDSEWVKES